MNYLKLILHMSQLPGKSYVKLNQYSLHQQNKNYKHNALYYIFNWQFTNNVGSVSAWNSPVPVLPAYRTVWHSPPL